MQTKYTAELRKLCARYGYDSRTVSAAVERIKPARTAYTAENARQLFKAATGEQFRTPAEIVRACVGVALLALFVALCARWGID